MRKVLTFIGTGTAFSKKNINNTAFYKTKNKLVLFDCGETTFHEIINQDIINDKVKSIDVIITQFHSDYVGSLGSLVLYCNQQNIDINIIFPNKEMPYSLLTLFGINAKLYNVKTPNEVEDYYLKEYEPIHKEIDESNKVIRIPSYGYHFINDNDNFFYNSNILTDEIITMFKNKKIYYLYQDPSMNENTTPFQLAKLENLIEPKYRKRIMFMHLCDSCDIERIKNLGFETAR